MYKQADIVVVKFPFTDATEFKKRPALASGSTTNDYYVYDAGGNVLAVYPEDDNATGVDNLEFPIYAASKVGTYYAEKNQTDGYDNSISYEVTDHLGNVRSLINKKEDVTTTQSFDYYAYGGYQPTRQLVNTPRYRHAYQGQFAEKDDETNTLHFDARDYDPITGRWTTLDPARQHWSGYLGMGNNPISMVDPDGRVAWKAVINSGLNITGGILQVSGGVTNPLLIPVAADGVFRIVGSTNELIHAFAAENDDVYNKELTERDSWANAGAFLGGVIDKEYGTNVKSKLQLGNDIVSVAVSAGQLGYSVYINGIGHLKNFKNLVEIGLFLKDARDASKNIVEISNKGNQKVDGQQGSVQLPEITVKGKRGK